MGVNTFWRRILNFIVLQFHNIFFSFFVLYISNITYQQYEYVLKISPNRGSMKLRIQFTIETISLNCTCALNFRKTASNKAAAKQSLKRWQDIYFTVVNCLFYRSTWFPQSFINQKLLTIGLPHQLELGLSKKHTKFEKFFFMVWTFELVNVQTTMREIFLNFVWFSESPNFMGPKMNTQK